MPTSTSAPVAPASANVAIDGAKVREMRKRAGKKLTDFAPDCGIAVSYLGHIERGRRSHVSPPVFTRICDALGIPADERDSLTAA